MEITLEQEAAIADYQDLCKEQKAAWDAHSEARENLERVESYVSQISTKANTARKKMLHLLNPSHWMRSMTDILGEKLESLAERQRIRFANEYEAEQAPPDPEDDNSDMG